MEYVVKGRELKWAGKRLVKGAPVEPQSDRDHKHIELLAKIGKVELKPPGKPLGKVAETKPLVHTAALKAEEPQEAPAPEPVEPLTTDDAEALVPRTYRTRRLKAED